MYVIFLLTCCKYWILLSTLYWKNTTPSRDVYKTHSLLEPTMRYMKDKKNKNKINSTGNILKRRQ